MNKIMFSFLITTLAGFATLLGVIPCYLNKSRENIISKSLAFSAGVMITISLTSLIPESVFLLYSKYTNIFIFLIVFIFVVLGIIFSSFVDKKLEENFSTNKLYKLGLISVIALALHNIPEGITTFISTNSNITLGITLSLAIALHNIPEGISIAVPIYYATYSRKKAFWYTFLSGFSELLGAVLAYLFIARYINDFILALILGITAGIMIHISIYELLPNSWQYKKKKATMVSFFLGVLVMLICDYLI